MAEFAHRGQNVSIFPLAKIIDPASITIGADVTINPHVALEAVHTASTLIEIGDGCYFGFQVRIVAVNGVRLAAGVAVGHGVTLADTIHDYKNAGDDEHAWQAPLKVGLPLIVEEGAWIGNNTVVAGGVTLGRGCIIGANSSITHDVPPYTLVAGNPTRPVRRRGDDGRWHRVDDER